MNKTAKALGFKKGDFIWTGAFPGILVSDAHTATPCCEVWGFEQECGSVYAHDLRRLSYDEFLAHCQRHGHSLPLRAYHKTAQDALQQAEAYKQAKGA